MTDSDGRVVAAGSVAPAEHSGFLARSGLAPTDLRESAALFALEVDANLAEEALHDARQKSTLR